MASVVGSGALYVASWNAPPALAPNPVERSVLVEAAPTIELPSSTRRILTEVLAALAGRADGVSFTELRSALVTPTEDLRLALEAGLRLGEIRRTGSHNTLRYLSNSSA